MRLQLLKSASERAVATDEPFLRPGSTAVR